MKRFTFSLLFMLSLLLVAGSNDFKANRDVFGDLNGDNEVNIADINVLIDVILNGHHPSDPDPVATHTPNMTIAEFKAKHWQDARNYVDTVTEDEVIHGWVTSSDQPGNIYKTLYITDESGAGLSISINHTNLYSKYPIGQEIVLPMQGYFVGKYNGMQQLGYPMWYEMGSTWEVNFMPLDMWEQLAELNGAPDPDRNEVQPVDVNLSEFVGKNNSETLLQYQAKLARIKNVHFAEADGQTTYAESTVNGNQVILDADGNTLIVHTSQYADFASTPLPVGVLDIVGELMLYGTTWQLYMRSAADVTVVDPVAPEPDPLLSLDEGFDRGLPYDWKNIAVSGNKKWYQMTYQSNGYAAMTGYRGTQPPFDAWLITPALDIKNASSKVLTFRTQVNAYGSTMSQLEVYILDSREPTAATVKVKLNPVLATAPASGYSQWVESGSVDLSQWDDGSYYIGFRYYSPEDVNYSTWCLDDVRFGSE